MIVITGGIGFIGYNLIKKLNEKKIYEIIVVDNLEGKKKNLPNLRFLKYKKIIDFRSSIKELELYKSKIKCIFHNGANSDTSCWDAKDIIEKNYTFSKTLLKFALKNKVDFIYASSASIYGNNGAILKEDPLNLYAISKTIFDNYVKELIKSKNNFPIKIVGLRYFNVYGPYENHKTNMSSPIMTFYNQYKKEGKIKLFGSSNSINYKDFTRDFVHVKDICNINYLIYLSKKKILGIFDLGSGHTVSFYRIALIMKSWIKKNKKLNLKIQTIKFPDHLKNFYQFYTKSKNLKIKRLFKDYKFIKIEKGISEYLHFLEKNKK